MKGKLVKIFITGMFLGGVIAVVACRYYFSGVNIEGVIEHQAHMPYDSVPPPPEGYFVRARIYLPGTVAPLVGRDINLTGRLGVRGRTADSISLFFDKFATLAPNRTPVFESLALGARLTPITPQDKAAGFSPRAELSGKSLTSTTVRLLSKVEKGCVELGAVKGLGATNEDSILDLKKNAAIMGGNAAYMLDGTALLDPKTKKTTAVSNAGFAYTCP